MQIRSATPLSYRAQLPQPERAVAAPGTNAPGGVGTPVRDPRDGAGRAVSTAVSTAAPAPTYSDPRADARQKLQRQVDARQQHLQQQEVQSLAQRDREVRAHEQAHAAVGGQYAGAASYQTVRGPDGVSYAVAGEVPISTGKEATPEETLRKAQIVRRAALAPAEPSSQDRKVAAMARGLELEAQLELAREQRQQQHELVRSEQGTSGEPLGSASEGAVRAGADERTVAPPDGRVASAAPHRAIAAYQPQTPPTSGLYQQA